MDRLTKSTYFLPMNMIDKLELYIEDIVRLHEISGSIVSYRDLRFTFEFWKRLQKALGTNLRLSTSYQPQID